MELNVENSKTPNLWEKLHFLEFVFFYFPHPLDFSLANSTMHKFLQIHGQSSQLSAVKPAPKRSQDSVI